MSIPCPNWIYTKNGHKLGIRQEILAATKLEKFSIAFQYKRGTSIIKEELHKKAENSQRNLISTWKLHHGTKMKLPTNYQPTIKNLQHYFWEFIRRFGKSPQNFTPLMAVFQEGAFTLRWGGRWLPEVILDALSNKTGHVPTCYCDTTKLCDIFRERDLQEYYTRI